MVLQDKYYQEILDLIDFEPGSRFGYATVDFTYTMYGEKPIVFYKGNICEFSENGTLQKICESPTGTGTDHFSTVFDEDLEQASASLYHKRTKVSTAESLARSEGGAFGGANSGSESSIKSSQKHRQEYLQSGVSAESVQLDSEQGHTRTETISIQAIPCSPYCTIV